MRKIKLLLFFCCRALGLFTLARRLTRDRLRILCYHGFALADEAAFRPKLFIEPGIFRQRLETIARHRFRVLSLDQAIDDLYAGTLAEDALVITVDDGFHGFHRLAMPLLAGHGFPATVYLTTYYVQHGNPIFRLVVQYMFWKTPLRDLELSGVTWSDDRVIDLTEADARARAERACIEFGERHCTEDGRVALCRELGALLEVPYEPIVQNKILTLMSAAELSSLGAGVAVELHTHRHVFPLADRAAATAEIADNRAAIRQWLPQQQRHFCYPSGEWHERQWPWLDELQIKSSTTCLPGLNTPATPRHGLRRFLDGSNIHPLEFEAEISGFAELLRTARDSARRWWA